MFYINKNTDFVFQCHKLITISLGVSPYILPNYFLTYYIYFFFIVISHWYFLEGRCFMTKFQKPHNNKILFSDTLEYVNIYDIVIFSNILFTFYRLNNLWLGFILIPIFIGLNLLIYNNYGFRKIFPKSIRYK